MENERLVSPEKLHEDEQSAGAPVSLRPNSLKDFVGQPLVCENLKVFIEAAKKRGEALDHVLLFGPPVGQNHAGFNYSQRARGRFPGDLGADDFQVGRFGGNFD